MGWRRSIVCPPFEQEWWEVCADAAEGACDRNARDIHRLFLVVHIGDGSPQLHECAALARSGRR